MIFISIECYNQIREHVDSKKPTNQWCFLFAINLQKLRTTSSGYIHLSDIHHVLNILAHKIYFKKVKRNT